MKLAYEKSLENILFSFQSNPRSHGISGFQLDRSGQGMQARKLKHKDGTWQGLAWAQTQPFCGCLFHTGYRQVVDKHFLTAVALTTCCFTITSFALSPQCALMYVMQPSKQLCRPRMPDPSEILKETAMGSGSRRQKNSKHTNGESLKANKPLSTSCVFHENGALVSFISCYMCKVKSRGKRRNSNYTFNRKSMFFLNIILSFKTASCFEMILKPL